MGTPDDMVSLGVGRFALEDLEVEVHRGIEHPSVVLADPTGEEPAGSVTVCVAHAPG